MEAIKEVNRIPYDFSQEFADAWADINALYHTIDKLESRINGLIKWMRHSLPEQEYEVLRLRYAPHNKGGRLTLEEVGVRMGLTKERVRQIEAKALKRLDINFYKTEVVYARGGRDDGHGVRAALSANKKRSLPE